MLDIRSLAVFYGDACALKDISIIVKKREIVALLGSNGAGKTTLLNAVTRRVKVRGGTIKFNGRDLTWLPIFKLVKEGIACVPEGRELFNTMRVVDNLLLGTYALDAPTRKEMLMSRMALVFKLFPVLKQRLRQVAETLSGGEQQMLALGRALMSNPRLLVLDEPSLGLSPMLVQEMAKQLKTITGELGVSILLAEQNARAALKIADYVYVMENGTIKLEGTKGIVGTQKNILSAYLGG